MSVKESANCQPHPSPHMIHFQSACVLAVIGVVYTLAATCFPSCYMTFLQTGCRESQYFSTYTFENYRLDKADSVGDYQFHQHFLKHLFVPYAISQLSQLPQLYSFSCI